MAGVAVAPPEKGSPRPATSAAAATGSGGEKGGGGEGDCTPTPHKGARPARQVNATPGRVGGQPLDGGTAAPSHGGDGVPSAGEEEDALMAVVLELTAVTAALVVAGVGGSGGGSAKDHAAAASAALSEPPSRSADWVAAATLWRASLRGVLNAAANRRAAAALAADADVAAAAAAATAAEAITQAADAAAARRLHRQLNGDVPPGGGAGGESGCGSSSNSAGGSASSGAGTSRSHAALAAARAVAPAVASTPALTMGFADKGKQPAEAFSRQALSERAASAADKGLRDKGKQPAGAPPRVSAVAEVKAAVAAIRIASDATGVPVKCDVCLSASPTADNVRHACGHLYCTACMTASFVKATREPDLLPLRCCGKPIDVTLVERLPLEAAAIAAFKAAYEEATAVNKMYCPVDSCSAFVNVGRLIPAGTTPAEAHPCPRCATPLCLRCKARSHAEGVSCADAAAARAAAADGAAERAVRALAAAAGWQTCPACAAVVELVVGCFHMQCRCGASFCYTCGVKWKRCSCPLWDEQRVVLAATEEVDRQDRVRGRGGGGAPDTAAARGARVAAAANRMREHGHDECAHEWGRSNAWRLTTGRCERCNYHLPVYGYVCGGRCAVTVCYTCRWHRMA